MIATLSIAALAVPPKGEVITGWTGNADHGYGFTTVQPALVRADDGQASFVARATLFDLYYSYVVEDELYLVRSPGVSVGPGVVITPWEDVSLSAAIGVEVRQPSESEALMLDASLSGGAQWRPNQRAALYGVSSFSATNRNVWIRVGGMIPVIPPAPRDAPWSLWLGVEGTSVGTGETALQEIGGVAEVPIRDLRAAISARAGLASQELGEVLVRRGTFGLGLYWSYY